MKMYGKIINGESTIIVEFDRKSTLEFDREDIEEASRMIYHN